MSKQTNPDWPDPTDWAQRLHSQLEVLGEEYFATPWQVADDSRHFAGLNLKQARATEILIAVHRALRELPLFENSKGAAVLHDVAGALHDVVMGGSPRLFAMSTKGKPGGDGIARNYLKVFVVRSVRLLVEAHDWRETMAVKAVAGRFAAAGATGRKGNPLSASTVQDWCNKAKADSLNLDDAKVGREVEAFIEKCRTDPNWPVALDNTLGWIERMAKHPLLSSKYG
ncbi:MAG: hypothetical protein O9293_05790 [Porphyrobacter sp.]|nr:hypothetical protein [Porphyrobacter sp.]